MDPIADLTARLPEGRVSTHPEEVAGRARDRWVLAMLRERAGNPSLPPSAVVSPQSTEEVAQVLAWATDAGVPVVPRGGGSGVSGGAMAVRGGIVLDLSRLDRILEVDETSRTATVEAGVRGDRLEERLAESGLTTGHYPQSLAISTVGGWIAARSAGQASTAYGPIEDRVLGLVAVLADGRLLRMRPVPRSAAGLDLRLLFAGSEGTLGVVTEATLALERRPDLAWLAWRLPAFEAGLDLARPLVQEGIGPVILRVYDEPDALLSFGSIGHERGAVAIAAIDAGVPGADERAAAARTLAPATGAEELPASYGEHWWERRFDAVELYERIMGPERAFGDGVVVETVEMAGLWRDLADLYAGVGAALRPHAEAVGCHVSHGYGSGASLYFTMLIREASDEEAERAYLAAWEDAARACHEAGGTVTHHHGVGVLKAPFMEAEVGPAGVQVLRALEEALDPARILNPGKVVPGA